MHDSLMLSIYLLFCNMIPLKINPVLTGTNNRNPVLLSSCILTEHKHLKQKSETIQQRRSGKRMEKWKGPTGRFREYGSAPVFILITWKAPEDCCCEAVEFLRHSRVQYSNLPKGNQRYETEFILWHIFCLYGDHYKQIPPGNSLCITLISCAILTLTSTTSVLSRH